MVLMAPALREVDRVWLGERPKAEMSADKARSIGEVESMLESDEAGIGAKRIEFGFDFQEHQAVGAIGERFFEPVHGRIVFSQAQKNSRNVVRRDVLLSRLPLQLIEEFLRFRVVSGKGRGMGERGNH